MDLGITGKDQLAEYEACLDPARAVGYEQTLDLGFGGCKLQVQVPENGPITESKDLIGKTITTSFVGLAKKFFDALEEKHSVQANGEQKPKTRITYLNGSIELSCSLGLSDGVIDLVGSVLLFSGGINNI